MKDPASHTEFVAAVAACVRSYCRGELNRAGADRLVRIAAKTAEHKLWGRLRAASLLQETSVEQQALSIVGALFKGTGKNSLLANALEDALGSDDISVFQRFQAIVVRVASQELFHRWDENDPLSARLWRSLHRGLRRDPRLILFPKEKPLWVALVARNDDKGELIQLSLHEIAGLVGAWQKPLVAVADLVIEILAQPSVVSSQKGVLSIDMLFAALRDARVETVAAELSDMTPPTIQDPHLQLAIKKATDATRQDMDRKLERYGTTGKLPSDALKRFREALIDLLTDCADGGPAQSNYKYLKAHWPELAHDVYRQSYRARFEYLAEYVQDRFSQVLQENYVP